MFYPLLSGAFCHFICPLFQRFEFLKQRINNSSITHMLSETMHQQQQILHLHTYTFFLVTHFDALLLIWKCCNTYRMDHIFLKTYLSNYKRIVLWSFFFFLSDIFWSGMKYFFSERSTCTLKRYMIKIKSPPKYEMRHF